MTNTCGFCRDVRLFFRLLKQHTVNFITEFNEYREVCEIAQEIKPLSPFPVTKTIRDIREQAAEQFKGVDDSLIIDIPPDEGLRFTQSGSTMFMEKE